MRVWSHWTKWQTIDTLLKFVSLSYSSRKYFPCILFLFRIDQIFRKSDILSLSHGLYFLNWIVKHVFLRFRPKEILFPEFRLEEVIRRKKRFGSCIPVGVHSEIGPSWFYSSSLLIMSTPLFFPFSRYASTFHFYVKPATGLPTTRKIPQFAYLSTFFDALTGVWRCYRWTSFSFFFHLHETARAHV